MNKYLVLSGSKRDTDRAGRPLDETKWSFEEISNHTLEGVAEQKARKLGATNPSREYFLAKLISKVETPLPPIKPL